MGWMSDESNQHQWGTEQQRSVLTLWHHEEGVEERGREKKEHERKRVQHARPEMIVRETRFSRLYLHTHTGINTHDCTQTQWNMRNHFNPE